MPLLKKILNIHIDANKDIKYTYRLIGLANFTKKYDKISDELKYMILENPETILLLMTRMKKKLVILILI